MIDGVTKYCSIPVSCYFLRWYIIVGHFSIPCIPSLNLIVNIFICLFSLWNCFQLNDFRFLKSLLDQMAAIWTVCIWRYVSVVFQYHIKKTILIAVAFAFGWLKILFQSFFCCTISCLVFSERELTFAICYRLSVCRLSVCLSSVCNGGAPYSGGSNFPQYFYGIRYLGHPLTSTENFTEIVPGEPLRRGS